MASPRSNRLLAIVLATSVGGCATMLDGPSAEASLGRAKPECDDSKGLVVVDGLSATAMGLAAAAVSPVFAVVGLVYLITAVRGSHRVDECREAIARYSRPPPDVESPEATELRRAREAAARATRVAESLDPAVRLAQCRRIDAEYEKCHAPPPADEQAAAEDKRRQQEIAEQKIEQGKLAAARAIQAKREADRVAAEEAAKVAAPDLPAPALEVVAAGAAIELPRVARFALPPVEPGLHHPTELRLDGNALLDTEIEVKGYVVWRDDTSLYLATTNALQLDRGIRVVGVPASPKLAIGDLVTIRGTWKVTASAPDARLVFAAVDRARPGRAVASPPLAAIAQPAVATAEVPARAKVDSKALASSLQLAVDGNRAMRARDFAGAIDAFARSTTAWPGNHLAWFGLGGSYAFRGDWTKASVAYGHAAELRPDVATYHLWLGIALAQSSSVALPAARESLVRATTLEPRLWRAHYTLGRVFAIQGRPIEAAAAFATAIAANPSALEVFAALADLYRRWEHPAEAIAVAERGLAGFPTPDDARTRAELAYTIGLAQRDDDAAIAAFTQALVARPDHVAAKLERARVRLRRNDRDGARRDLDELGKLDAPGLELERALATELAAKAN